MNLNFTIKKNKNPIKFNIHIKKCIKNLNERILI